MNITKESGHYVMPLMARWLSIKLETRTKKLCKCKKCEKTILAGMYAGEVYFDELNDPVQICLDCAEEMIRDRRGRENV